MKLGNTRQISKILSEKTQNIVIITHVNPDGDAIGSSLGLYEFLKNCQYDSVSAITPNDYASFLKWMPGNEEIIIASGNFDKATRIINKADIIFCLDFNDPKRTDNLESLIINAKAKTILIDHHPQPFDSFDFVISDIDSSSTAELIYKFLKSIGCHNDINKNVAACLYAGIMTDTGSFSYGCNNPETFSICADLVKTGINPGNIHRLIYDTYSLNRMKLLGYCLSQRLTVINELNTAYIYLTREDLVKFDHQEGDTEGIVNYALSIRNIAIAALFIEEEDYIKVSLRSVGEIDMNSFARCYFNGGGHKNAAGGRFYDSIIDSLEYFKEVLYKFHKGKFKETQSLQP